MMSNGEETCKTIKAKRETRDRIMLQHSIPMLEHLRDTVQNWIDGEFRDLEEEMLHVDSHAPSTRASERINGYRIELSQIRSEYLPKAITELNELIEYVKEQRFASAEDAIETLKSKVASVLGVMFALTKARERLDGMADMIEISVPEET